MDREKARELMSNIVAYFAEKNYFKFNNYGGITGIMENGALLSCGFGVMNIKEQPILDSKRYLTCHTPYVTIGMNEMMRKWLDFLYNEGIESVYTSTDMLVFPIAYSDEWVGFCILSGEEEYVDPLTHRTGWKSRNDYSSLLHDDDDELEM